MLLDEPLVGAARDAKQLGDLFGVFARLQTGGEDNHIHRDTALLADQRIFNLDDQSVLFFRYTRHVGHFSDLAAHEVRPLFEQALVELFVAFARRAYVNIKLIDFRAGLFTHQVGKFKALHTADGRTVGIVVLVAAAHAMNNPH